MFVRVMRHALYQLPILGYCRHHFQCVFPIPDFSFSRLASHNNYRIVPVMAIEYGSEGNLDYEKDYVQLLVAVYSSVFLCLNCLSNS